MNDTYVLIFPEKIALGGYEGRAWQITVKLNDAKNAGPTKEQIAATVKEYVLRAMQRNG